MNLHKTSDLQNLSRIGFFPRSQGCRTHNMEHPFRIVSCHKKMNLQTSRTSRGSGSFPGHKVVFFVKKTRGRSMDRLRAFLSSPLSLRRAGRFSSRLQAAYTGRIISASPLRCSRFHLHRPCSAHISCSCASYISIDIHIWQ